MRRRAELQFVFLLPLIILASLLLRASNAGAQNAAANPPAQTATLFIYFLDCARGSSTIIDNGDHEIIIDACSGDELSTFLKRYPIIQDPLELVVVTQPSANTFEGFMKGVPIKSVGEIWDPGLDRSRSSYAKFLDQSAKIFPGGALRRPLENFHKPVLRSNQIERFQLPSMPEITFTLLNSESHAPEFKEMPEVLQELYQRYNSSIVLMIEVAGLRLLFPSAILGKLREQDAATAKPSLVEGKLLELEAHHPGLLRADLILAPRGGSESSSTQKFIDAVAPRIAIFSANPQASLPAPSVVTRYERTARIFSTGVHFEPALDNVICTNRSDAFDQLPPERLRCTYGATPSAPVTPQEPEMLTPQEDFDFFAPQLESWGGLDNSKKRALTRLDVMRYLNRRAPQTDADAGAPPETLQGSEALIHADLSGIDLHKENFNGRSFAQANLSWADLSGSNLTSASLEGATTDHMYLDSTTVVRGANLAGTCLFSKDMPKDFRGTVLTNTTLQGVDLTGAVFVDANLQGAKVKDSDLTGAVFEPLPGSIPSYTEMAVARNGYLKTLKFETSPHALVELREAFKKAGLRDQERELTYAIERERNSRKRGIDYWFRRILFDLSSQYGMSPNRPLKIIGIFIFLFAIPYVVALFTRTGGGIWVVSLPDRVENPATKNTSPSRLTTNFTWSPRFSLRRVGQWFRILFLGLYFSVLSAFQLGYRDFNVGSWILRLQAKEHTLRATGWVRVVSGIQSLTSVYLLALWVLLYFGNPFE